MSMVFETPVDIAVRLVFYVGIPLLVGLFYLEGLVVGKVLQPPAVFVTVVAVTRPSWPVLAALSVACTAAVVAGQWALYRSFDEDSPAVVGLRGRVPHLDRLPTIVVDRVGDRRLRFVDTLFDRYGGAGILLATFLPVVRGLLAIPAGLSTYPPKRFLAFSLLGNALYFPALVAVAFGILRVL